MKSGCGIPEGRGEGKGGGMHSVAGEAELTPGMKGRDSCPGWLLPAPPSVSSQHV